MSPHGKNGENLSCGEIPPHEKCGDKYSLSQFMLFCREIVFFPSTLFCREIYFVAIYALLRGEKFKQKLRICSKNNPMGVLMGTIAREPRSVAGGMRWCGV